MGPSVSVNQANSRLRLGTAVYLRRRQLYLWFNNLYNCLLRHQATMVSTLRTLANLIVQQVDTIEAACTKNGHVFPSPDELFSPESEAARGDPEVIRAVTLLCSAANEIALVARHPQATLMMNVLGVSAYCLFSELVDADLCTCNGSVSRHRRGASCHRTSYCRYSLECRRKCECSYLDESHRNRLKLVHAKGLHVKDIGSKARVDPSKICE